MTTIHYVEWVSRYLKSKNTLETVCYWCRWRYFKDEIRRCQDYFL